MFRKTLRCLVGAFLVIAMFSCAKLPESQIPTGIEGGLKMESLSLGNTIPLKLGELIAVSSVNQYPSWVQLWFKDKEGIVYMVSYNIETNTFYNKYRQIKRG
jgi:hypothetical protein